MTGVEAGYFLVVWGYARFRDAGSFFCLPETRGNFPSHNSDKIKEKKTTPGYFLVCLINDL